MIEQSAISYINPDCFHLIHLHSCPPCHTGATWGYTCCSCSGTGFWGRTECCCRLRPPHPTCPRSHRYRHSAILWGCRSKKIYNNLSDKNLYNTKFLQIGNQ